MAEVSVGSKLADFELPDQQGYPWCLSGQLEEGPVVLVFYRGDWCAYCNGQLVSYARGLEEFERRGAQVVGISVDPPQNNARMVGKLRLTFPLLSDPRAELITRYGLWDPEDGVARPSILVVDRSGEVRYLYSGRDFADRPGDDEVFGTLKGLEGGIERITGQPEIRVTGPEARTASIRPDKNPMELEQLLVYYRGAYFATVALTNRFGEKGRSGRSVLREVSGYQAMIRRYRSALEETSKLG
jgi:peroxiredoxin